MLKIKDNVDLKELEKYGFKQEKFITGNYCKKVYLGNDNAVKHCCICDNKKYGEFISINDEKYHLCCIEQLQQENKQLKERIDKVIEILKLCNSICAKESIEILKGDSNE